MLGINLIDLTKPIADFGWNFHYSIDEKYCLDLKSINRFFEKIEITDECWLWKGFISKHDGYGDFSFKSKTRNAHLISYLSLYNNYNDYLVLDHLCRVRECVNPFHLEPVTNKENTLRGISYCAQAAKKTHCPKGHEYNEENTWVRIKKGTEHRECRTCHRERKRVGNMTEEQKLRHKLKRSKKNEKES